MSPPSLPGAPRSGPPRSAVLPLPYPPKDRPRDGESPATGRIYPAWSVLQHRGEGLHGSPGPLRADQLGSLRSDSVIPVVRHPLLSLAAALPLTVGLLWLVLKICTAGPKGRP